MNKRSWFHYRLRYLKAPDGDGAGGGGSTPGSDTGGSSPPSGDGGGSSVPSTPSDGGGMPSTPPSTDSSDPWANLGSTEDLDHIEIPAAPPPAPTPQPTPQTPPVTPAQPQPAASPQQPQTPVTPPVAPQPQTQPPQEPSAPQVNLSPSDPAGMAVALEENAPALIQHLAQQRFALTPEEVQELETDVTTAVPKLLAKVHLHSQIAMQKFLAEAVPGMIQRHTQVSQANNEAENRFFETHKALGLDKANKQHRETAVRVARMYRQMYPQASLDQLISDIGPMVAQNLRLTTSPQTPQVPGQPVIARNVQPFRPAVNGGGGPLPSGAPADANEWAGLGQEFD